MTFTNVFIFRRIAGAQVVLGPVRYCRRVIQYFGKIGINTQAACVNLLRLGLVFSLCAYPAAAVALCSMTPSGGGSVSEICGSYLFSPNDYLNWGHPAGNGYSGFGQASSSASSGPWKATSAFGIGVTLNATTNELERFDNTQYAWSVPLNAWVGPNAAEAFQSDHPPLLPINTFGGHFNAPSLPTPVPDYGASLIGLVQHPTAPNPNSTVTLSFTEPVTGVGFRVSSGGTGDFIASLQAFDALNVLIGTYEVDATGLGGRCAGLQLPFPSENPVPCNDAPLIQFADPLGRIGSVTLTVNDQTAYFDDLQLQSDVPEPATSLMFGVGVLSLIGLRKRPTSGASRFSVRS